MFYDQQFLPREDFPAAAWTVPKSIADWIDLLSTVVDQRSRKCLPSVVLRTFLATYHADNTRLATYGAALRAGTSVCTRCSNCGPGVAHARDRTGATTVRGTKHHADRHKTPGKHGLSETFSTHPRLERTNRKIQAHVKAHTRLVTALSRCAKVQFWNQIEVTRFELPLGATE